jgi:phage-related minor tail protein
MGLPRLTGLFKELGNTLKHKSNTMSVDQAEAFVKGLKQLSDQFREDCATTTDVYKQETKGATKQFIDASHKYAKDMTGRADQYTSDIQALYNDIYGEGIDTPEEEEE